MTSGEISSQIEIQPPSVRRILFSLQKDVSVNIKFKNLTPKEKKKRYGHTVNPTLIRVYWIEKGN